MLKGARQVGKTWLVREFGKTYRSFIEINFERNPQFSSVFKVDLNPRRILNEVLDATGREYKPSETLLFFDEAQASPLAVKSLRYFYEELPDVHVICAGSLLEFVLDHIPTGVGRITYLDLCPMTLGEYLVAIGEERLRTKIQKQPLDEALPEIHHHKLLRLLHQYMLVGGMPGVVNEYVASQSFRRAHEAQRDLLRTLQDDFAKYAKSHQMKYLDLLVRTIPLQLGSKFIFSRLGENVRSRDFSPPLELLEKARIVHKAINSRADGIPLQARLNPRHFKVIMLDIGLTQNLMGVDLEEWVTGGVQKHVRGGPIAEAFVGQELTAYLNASVTNPLMYWHRESSGSTAEVDYLVQLGNEIIPLEVKEGASGRMRSLHLFLREKRGERGVRISSKGFGFDGNIQNLPLYAVERLFAGRHNA
ncbi:MAG: ATP-binding protein [Candidatus Neomarinimicrobiota bacterium]